MTLRTFMANLVWTTLVAAAAAAAWASGGTYRDSSGRFSVELPGGWALRPSAEVDEANAALSVVSPGQQLRYTAKFAPADAKDGKSPYVLVQWTPAELGDATWSQIEHELGSVNIKRVSGEIGQKLSGFASGLSTDVIAVDEGRRRFVLRLSMEVEGKRLLGQCVGFVGRHGLAQINCYALESEFASVQATYDALADSFRFDTGHEYSEPSLISRISWDSLLVRMVLFGLIGAVAAVIIKSRSGGGKRGTGAVRRRRGVARRFPPTTPPR